MRAGARRRSAAVERELRTAQERIAGAEAVRDQALADAARIDAALKEQAREFRAAAEEWRAERALLEASLRVARSRSATATELALLRDANRRLDADRAELWEQNDRLNREAHDHSVNVARPRWEPTP